MKLKEMKIMQMLSNVYNVVLLPKKMGGGRIKKEQGKVSSDITIFNQPRMDFYAK